MLILLLAALFAQPTEMPLELALAQHSRHHAPKKKPPPPAPVRPAPQPVKPAEPAPSDDFDLLPAEAKPDPAALARQQELERQLELRRTMLQWHQALGITTLVGLTGTAVLGQLDYLDKYGGGGDTGRFRAWHRWVALGTATVFATTATLAVLAPSPLPKETRLDRTTLHKVAMSVAAAGMVTQVVLGFVTAANEGSRTQRDLALAHQIVGYTTAAAAFTGFGVFTF